MSNLGTAGKEQSLKKSMNDVFAKYASVGRINLGNPGQLPTIQVTDDDGSMQDALHELTKSIRSDSQTRLAPRDRSTSNKRRSGLHLDPSSLLTDSNTQVGHGSYDQSQPEVSGFSNQKRMN